MPWLVSARALDYGGRFDHGSLGVSDFWWIQQSVSSIAKPVAMETRGLLNGVIVKDLRYRSSTFITDWAASLLGAIALGQLRNGQLLGLPSAKRSLEDGQFVGKSLSFS